MVIVRKVTSRAGIWQDRDQYRKVIYIKNKDYEETLVKTYETVYGTMDHLKIRNQEKNFGQFDLT